MQHRYFHPPGTRNDLRFIAQTNQSEKNAALNAHESCRNYREQLNQFPDIIFGRMRSVLCLFLIVADALMLHRKKRGRKVFQCSGLMNLNHERSCFCE